jgi:hypothetical protein
MQQQLPLLDPLAGIHIQQAAGGGVLEAGWQGGDGAVSGAGAAMRPVFVAMLLWSWGGGVCSAGVQEQIGRWCVFHWRLCVLGSSSRCPGKHIDTTGSWWRAGSDGPVSGLGLQCMTCLCRSSGKPLCCWCMRPKSFQNT